MLKQEIIEKITRYFKLTHFEAEKIYDNIFQSIIQGVKSDDFANISNLGEFIIKFNENISGGYKKTAEFLPSTSLKEEVNEAEGLPDEEANQKKDIPIVIENKPELNEESKPEFTEEVKPEIKQEVKKEEITFTPPAVVTAPVINIAKENLSVEDEIKKKREEIIQKLNPQHDEEYHRLLHVKEGINLNVPKPILINEPVKSEKEEFNHVKEETEPLNTEIPEIKEEIKEIKKEADTLNKAPEIIEKETVEELSTKSFSDYFTEIKAEQTVPKETYLPPVVPPVHNIIPPVAVDLHKEIMGEKPADKPEIPFIPEPKPISQNGNGNIDNIEQKTEDNSYYIWYKDSEPNAVDTQTMSYEYELLYQATKEAEYKSKLRIYVTTFIMFFSIVLILLIFSPVIYKYFFTPSDEQNNDQVQPTEQSTSQEQPNNKAEINTLNTNPQTQENSGTNQQNPAVNEQTTQPSANEKQNSQTEQKTTTPPVTEQKTDQQKQPEQQNVNIPGLVKSSAGWIDEKNRVIYVQLDNGKFAIQESSWDSNEKAGNRISIVSRLNISGMSGSIIKADLGNKGVWYRARFGEFSTLQEAKSKADELRSK